LEIKQQTKFISLFHLFQGKNWNVPNPEKPEKKSVARGHTLISGGECKKWDVRFVIQALGLLMESQRVIGNVVNLFWNGAGPQQTFNIITERSINRLFLTPKRPFLGAKWGF